MLVTLTPGAARNQVLELLRRDATEVTHHFLETSFLPGRRFTSPRSSTIARPTTNGIPAKV